MKFSDQWILDMYTSPLEWSCSYTHTHIYTNTHACVNTYIHIHTYGFPRWLSGKESACLTSIYIHYIHIHTYLRLLIFLPAILITACASSSPAFLIMYSAYKLNKQGDNIQPWRTPFPIWKQSIVPCPVLTVASWSAYRFLKRHVR